MYQLLKSGLWKVTRDCPVLVRSMPTLIRDERRLEDVLKVDASENDLGDDAADSARYGLKTRLSPRGKPLEVRVMERVEQVAHNAGLESFSEMNPTSRAMVMQKAIHDQHKRSQPAKLFRPRYSRRTN